MTESNITFSFQDTVAVTKHMVYDFEDNESEVPDLECYKEQLVSQMLRSSFFQSEIKDDLDMMKIPNIIIPHPHPWYSKTERFQWSQHWLLESS